jgi:hypothetical protein
MPKRQEATLSNERSLASCAARRERRWRPEHPQQPKQNMVNVMALKAKDRQPSIKTKDHKALTKLLEDVLNAHLAGEISGKSVRIGLQHMLAAVDKAKFSVIQEWIYQSDLKLFRGLTG